MIRFRFIWPFLSCLGFVLSGCFADDVFPPVSNDEVEDTVASRPWLISVLGDSYSTFEGWVVPDTNRVFYFDGGQEQCDVNSVDQMWWHILTHSADSAFSLLVNNSCSGSPICNTGYAGTDASHFSFISRMQNIGYGMDLIIVQGAVNDSWAKVPLGSFIYDDFSADDLFSFRPALAYLFSELIARHPQARVVFLLSDGLMFDINSSVSTICNHYGVVLIKLSGILKQTGHPTIDGQRNIAISVDSVIRRLCPVR